MAFTFVAAVNGQNGSGSAVTTVDATSSLNVQAGDLLVAWVKHEQAATTVAVAKNSGSPANSFTFDAGDYRSHPNNMHVSFGYLLSAASDSSMTPRVTLGAARTFVRMIVLQFRPDAGETVSKVASNSATGSSTSPASGNISPTGDDLVVVGGYGERTAQTTTNEQINGVAATEPTGSPATFASAWYRILTTGFTNGQATASIASSGDWACGVIAFSSAGGSFKPAWARNANQGIF